MSKPIHHLTPRAQPGQPHLCSSMGDTQFDSVSAEFIEGFYFNFWNGKCTGVIHHSERTKA